MCHLLRELDARPLVVVSSTCTKPPLPVLPGDEIGALMCRVVPPYWLFAVGVVVSWSVLLWSWSTCVGLQSCCMFDAAGGRVVLSCSWW